MQKKLYLILMVLLLISVDSKAQYEIGDITVESLNEVFKPENIDLWKGAKENRGYVFDDTKSAIWQATPLSGLILHDDLKRANFIAQKNPKAVINKVRRQLNQYFGKFEEVKIGNPVTLAGGGKVKMSKWVHQINDNLYEILLGKLNKKTVILIIKQKES